MLRIVVFWLLFLPLCLPAAAQSAPVADVGPVLTTGDRVRIIVWRNGDLTGEFQVSPSGALQHPLYREVNVAGVPLAEAEARVQAFLTRYQTEPQFTMEPLFRVFVSGVNVGTGVFHLPPHLTLADAIREAGGTTAPNRSLRIRHTRGEEVNLIPMSESSTHLLGQTVEPGDQIVIERRPSLIRDVITPAATLTTGLWSIYSILNAMGLLEIF